jgi:hypothetical protein
VTSVNITRLVSDTPLSTGRWQAVQYLILELQPARSARLEGDPPYAIRIEAYGELAEVAPGLLAEVERLTMTSLCVEGSGPSD